MKYRVIRIQEPLSFGGWEGTLEVAALTDEERAARFSTEYIVDAETPFDAAVSAEGMADGFTDAQMDEDQGGARTRREQIEDRILHYSINGKHGNRRTDGGIVFPFNNIASDNMIVYEEG